MTNLYGEVQDKVMRLVALNMRPCRIVMGPGFHAALVREIASYTEPLQPLEMERVFGLPVLILKDIEGFEVSVG